MNIEEEEAGEPGGPERPVIGQQAVAQLTSIPWDHNLVAEYALSDIHKPIGVSEYQLTQCLPEGLKSSLPSVEEIEAEFSEGQERET